MNCKKSVVYLYFAIFIFFRKVTFTTTQFKCIRTKKVSSSKLLSKKLIIVKKNYNNTSYYINIFSNSLIIKHILKVKEYNIFKLLLVRNVYITNRITIFNCKILMFDGMCEDRNWYTNSIKYNEKVNNIYYCINIINWHSDGVFHGTVEGLTRIIPFLDFILKNKHIYIHISYPRYKQNTAEKILLLLGFSKSRIIYGNYYANNLYIPVPFYCTETSTVLVKQFNKILRNKIYNKNCKIKHLNYILLIQRSKNRIFYNIKKLLNELNQNFNYTIIVYYDNNRNLEEVYCWFTYAKLIIAYHGSGLTNLYFCSRNIYIIEIAPRYSIYAFAKIASQLRINYYIYRLEDLRFKKHIIFNITLFMKVIKEYIIF